MTDAPRIVDVWMQHPNPAFANHPVFESLRRWMGVESFVDAIPIEVTLGAMDAAGIRKGLICAWWGPNGPLITNDEVAALVAARPDRFAAMASVDLFRPMEAVRELRRLVKQHGFIAVRQLPWLWNLPPTDRHFYPIYAECVELGIPICMQVGHTGPMRPSEPGRPIPYIDEVALDFPELVIVGGHIGYPWTQEMIAIATKHPNVYIDTSAYTARRYPRELVEYMRTNGKRKVMFGSNYPMISPVACLEHLGDLGLDDERRELFLWGNAERVFRLGA